jgi:hypothetical protein
MQSIDFNEDTLRALGLNEAGVRKAWFRVVHTAYTRRGNVKLTHSRHTTAGAANKAYRANRLAGRDAMIEVWWTGDCEPVRHWSLAPLTTDQKRAAALGFDPDAIYYRQA